jgi:hypothetical protein
MLRMIELQSSYFGLDLGGHLQEAAADFRAIWGKKLEHANPVVTR